VRELAALLGVRYRQLPDGEISHSPVIVLLDQEGVVAQRMENAADDPAPLMAAVVHAQRAK
jgi:protein SCO1/2